MVPLMIFISGMGLVFLFFIYMKYRRQPKGVVCFTESNKNIGDKTQGYPDAIIHCIHKSYEAHLGQERIDELMAKYPTQIKIYTYCGRNIIMVQEDPGTGELEPWSEQRHAISELAPNCKTPQALAEMTEWKLTVGKYFQTSSVGLQAFNRTMMTAIMIGLGLLAYLFYSAQTGA